MNLDHLRRLTLHVRRGMGDRPGDRRFPGRPQPAGIELEAHSDYVPGDDLRHLDWNAVGRLDTLLVRRFTAEREVLVHLLLDASASMAVPARDGKLAVARELALSLACVALAANDAVRIAVLSGDGAARVSPVLRARGSLGRAAELLAAVVPGGRLGLGAALEAYAREHPRPGLAIVVSDLMMEPADVERGVQALRARRYEVFLLHVIGAGELDPGRELAGGVLADVETGATHAVALTPAVRACYAELLAAHLGALEALAERNRALYTRLASDASVHDFLTLELPRRGILRRR
jgi:uncharacterized protein (DUF58 family)